MCLESHLYGVTQIVGVYVDFDSITYTNKVFSWTLVCWAVSIVGFVEMSRDIVFF